MSEKQEPEDDMLVDYPADLLLPEEPETPKAQEALVVVIDAFLGKSNDRWRFRGRRQNFPTVTITFTTGDGESGKTIRDSLLAGKTVDFGLDPGLVEEVETKK